MQDTESVDKWRQELLVKIRIIGERWGFVDGRWSLAATLTKTLGSYACERRIKHSLENGSLVKEGQRFDPYYREKSKFATIKILECLKTRLHSEGLDATILTEAPGEIGRYDVVVIQGSPCQGYDKSGEIVRIEVKASLGVNLEQIDRYLWDSSPLILARVITGHVAKIEPLALKSYVLFSLRQLNAKAARLLSGKLYTTPGINCRSCHDSNCQYNRNRNGRWEGIVSMSDGEFERDLNSFFENLGYVAERTASLVVEEMKGISSMQNTQRISSRSSFG